MTSQFARYASREEYWAEATVETAGQMCRLITRIDGQRDLCLPGAAPYGKDADADREKARQWMALCELAQRSTQDFAKGSGELPNPNIVVPIPDPPGGRPNWTVEELRRYVDQKLAGHSVEEWKPGLWQVKPRD